MGTRTFIQTCRTSKRLNNDKVVFVVGNSRSGTTLMGSILGNHASIFTFKEFHFFDSIIASSNKAAVIPKAKARTIIARLLSIQAGDFMSPQPIRNFMALSDEIIENFSCEYLKSSDIFLCLASFLTRSHGKSIACEHTPQNVFYIKDILDLYPNCRIINIVRDPRDILLSQKFKWKVRFLGTYFVPLREVFRAWSNYHPVITSRLWNSAVSPAERFQDHPRVKTVKFEELVLQPEDNISRICKFVGIDYDQTMLNVSPYESGVSSHKNVSSLTFGFDPNVLQRWKVGGLTNAEIYICQSITSLNMEKYNYPKSSVSLWSKVLSGFTIISLPFKLTLSLILNLGRTRNFIEAIQRRVQFQT